MFCNARFIESQASEIFMNLKEENYLQGFRILFYVTMREWSSYLSNASDKNKIIAIGMREIAFLSVPGVIG